MPITLTFDFPLNVSIQLGDQVYYCPTTMLGTHDTGSLDDMTDIGPVTDITPWDGTESIIEVDTVPGQQFFPSNGDFIMFSKNNTANLSSLLGYYAEVKVENNSNKAAELFTVGAEVVESSK